MAVGILALPPQEPPAVGFWTKIAEKVRKKVSPKEELPATRLRIEPQIDFDDARRGLHTPISALHPYVVMEDGTRYAISAFIPNEWVGEWSEPKERPEGGEFYISYIGGNREVFRQRDNFALLVRLNGDTPLAERRRESSIKDLPPIRNEMLMGINEDTEVKRPYITAMLGKRQVIHEAGLGQSKSDKDEGKNTEVSDLEFHVVAERGTEENAKLDNKGLIEVIVVCCVDDEVIETIKEPPLHTKLDLPQTSSHGDVAMKGFSFGAPVLGGPRSIPDSTIKGETEFTNTRREKVSIHSVRNVKPVARFKFALVGSGGPITASMTEAPDPIPQS